MGGALDKTKAIDNYYGFSETISGKKLLENGLKQAERLNIVIDTDEVIGVSFNGEKYDIETRNHSYESKALVIAMGTNRSTPKINGVKKLEGKGISYCAICDAFFYRQKEVGVLGSGDYAIKEAKILSPIAKKITILTNGEKLVENRSFLDSNIQINEKEIKELRGDIKLEKINFKDETDLKLDGLFIAIRNCF